MSIIKASGAGEVSTGIYNGVVQNSLRFNGSDATLNRTIGSSGGDRQKNVWSFWAKFFDLQGDSGNHYFYSKGDNGPYADVIVIALSNHRIQIQGVVDDATTHNVITTRKFRDPTAWYHFVIAIDTTQATAEETPTLALLLFLESVPATETRDKSEKFLNPTTWFRLLTGFFHFSYSISLSSE